MLASRFARWSRQVKTPLFKPYCQSFFTSSLYFSYTKKLLSAVRVFAADGALRSRCISRYTLKYLKWESQEPLSDTGRAHAGLFLPAAPKITNLWTFIVHIVLSPDGTKLFPKELYSIPPWQRLKLYCWQLSVKLSLCLIRLSSSIWCCRRMALNSFAFTATAIYRYGVCQFWSSCTAGRCLLSHNVTWITRWW